MDKLQAKSAIEIIKSDTVEIPMSIYGSGSATSTVSEKLVDTSADFGTVRPGFILYNVTDGTSTVVKKVEDANTLVLAEDIVTSGEKYILYFKNINEGAVLYVGTGGDLKVELFGGSVVTLTNVNDGQFIPVQVVKVFSTGTTADNIVALW
jgi:hypothetical protein